MLSVDIYNIIGLKIDIPNDFFNFILAIKNIANKQLLISLKRKQFTKIVEEVKYGEKRIYYKLPNGKTEGLYQSWYENGQLSLQCNYINDVLEGPYKSWHKNGQLHIECKYVNGKRIVPEETGMIMANYIRNLGLFKFKLENGKFVEK
jgi:antitoxin component YwqK of YwqJK toxin-antitoxin module